MSRRGRKVGRPSAIALLTGGIADDRERLGSPLDADEGRIAGAAPGTPRLQAMLNLVRGGTSPRRAALTVGVGRSTWMRWVQEADVNTATWEARNERCSPELRAFWALVERAHSGWIATLSLSVTAGVQRNPAIGVKLLRRADPEGPWDIDVEGEGPAAPGVAIGSVDKAVILIPEGQARELLRSALQNEAADEGEAEDDEVPDLGALSERAVPAGARRVGP
ncbi:MAG TPA: hypothetical protein VF024_11175 [Solirubrobacteraceae bacterium]